jgi:ribosomal protein S18 acetylase RimI-like enzyme
VYVDEFWISSQYQSKGIGKYLLRFIEKKYKKRGEIYIDLIANQKSGAVDFYKKLGYKTKQWLLYMNKKLK